MLADAVLVLVLVMEPVRVPVAEFVWLLVAVLLAVMLDVTDRLAVALRLSVALDVMLDVSDRLGVTLELFVMLGVTVGVTMLRSAPSSWGVFDAVNEVDGNDDAVCDGDGDAVSVRVADSEGRKNSCGNSRVLFHP